MRHPSALPRILTAGLAAAAVAVGVAAAPSFASPSAAPKSSTAPAAARTTSASISRSQSPLGASAATDLDATQSVPLSPGLLRPRAPEPKTAPTKTTATTKATTSANTATAPKASTPAAKSPAASCTPADFGSRTGSALVTFLKASTTDCVNTLFPITGADAHKVFAEAQMVSVANALRTVSAAYPGNDSTSVWQLVLFLRAGYYVQFYDPKDVPAYGPTLAKAVEGALDAFLATPHAADVSDVNGQILGEVLVLTDSANEQGRYLNTYKRILNAYNSSYDAFPNLVAAVNDVFTPLFRGHQNPAFVSAVTADPSIIDTLDAFALKHLSLLGTDNSYLEANSGVETARFIQHAALQAKVRPLTKGLLDATSMTGRTAPMWVGVAGMTDYYDKAQCSYYNTCNLTARLTAAVLPITHKCDSTRTILAQSLSSSDLAAACTSLENQDAYFHSLVKDSGPVPNQYESTIQIVVFASRDDYQTYAGAIYGVDTNNGGITLSGDPTDPNNQPKSIEYIKSLDDGFVAGIWNLNHEYTHYLDGVYDMKGDFSAEIAVPDIWWIEGLAEYVSYSYRGVDDTEAIAEAAAHTYNLSTLWQSTYSNSDVTRTYPWGYLAVRYMVEKHPADIAAMLADFRAGNYTAAYAVYNTGIGTRYDADFNSWLNACAAGACAGGQPPAPPCTGQDNRLLDKGCSRQAPAATTGNLDYFYIWLPAGTTTLTVSSSGGTGDADLSYNSKTWASSTAYTAKSATAGNKETLTVTNTSAGYRYISLYAKSPFSGVTVSARY